MVDSKIIQLKEFGPSPMLILCLMLNLMTNSGNASVFSYVPKMENLLVIQKHVIQSARKHLSNLGDAEKRLVQGYITRWQAEHRKAMNNTTRYLENPINAYTLVRRLVVDLKFIEDILIWDRFKEYKRKKKMAYPSDHAMKGANAAFIHLIIVYNLNISELANGTLNSNFNKRKKPFIEFASPMTASDCYELAQAGLKYNEYEIALAWGKEAFYKYPQDCIHNCYFTEWDTVQFVSQLYADLGEFQKSLYWLEKNKTEELTPFLLNEYEKKVKYLKDKLKTQKYVKNFTSGTETQVQSTKKPILREKWKGTSKTLCFAERINHNNLTCHYKLGPDPFLRLARLKVETLHLEPEVTMFHDVISDGESLALQKMAEEADEMDPVYDHLLRPDTLETHWNCQGTMALHYLIRHVACFTDVDEWPLAAITRRSTDISGLDNALVIPTRLFISNYGVAGYHNPHYDRGTSEYFPLLGTVLYYLNEANEGGATIFTELNLSVFPKKNSALYWRNLLPCGRENPKTKHAACPVLHGSKWIVTKWMSDYFKNYLY